MTYYGQFFSLRAFKPALLFSALCLFAWSSQAKNVYRRALRYQLPGQELSTCPLVEFRFFYANSPNGDLRLWPELANFNSHYQSASGITWYYTKPHSFENWPYAYVPTGSSSAGTVPDSWTDDDLAGVQNAYNSLPQQYQAAISGFSGYATNNENPFVKDFAFTYRTVGTSYGGGVIVNDSSGTPYLAYPNEQGFVQSYDVSGPNSFAPVWYDTSSGTPVKLDALPSAQSALTYDAETGLYNFDIPNYSPQLDAISENLLAIRNKQYDTDLHVDVSAPDVTVNPQVTVNPTVSVPAPDVTVNVTSPSQNDITVAVDNSELIASIREWQESTAYSSELLSQQVDGIGVFAENINDALQVDDGSLSDIDDSTPFTTQEEQAVIDVYTGWQTGVPGMASQFDIGLDTLIGPIPQMGSSLDVGQLSVGPYNLTLSLSQYSSIIAWFRAACLACLLVLFGYNLWNIITQSMQV